MSLLHFVPQFNGHKWFVLAVVVITCVDDFADIELVLQDPQDICVVEFSAAVDVSPSRHK